MASLVVYGSLMAKDELKALGICLSQTMPVVVQGFRRCFAQEPSWRKGEGLERAVLTVVRSPKSSFNGILLWNLSEEVLVYLDKRERGYNRHLLSRQNIRSFVSKEPLNSDDPFVYVGKSEQYNPNLQPNPIYKEKCIHAAHSWGSCFRQEFMQCLLQQ